MKTVEALYVQKDFAKALQTLEANKSKISPGLWHYNMGTVYAGMKEFGKARFHLLQAEREGFVSKESEQNLEVVESALDTTRLEKPLAWSDYAVRGAMIASEGILSTLALFILIAGMIGVLKKKSLALFSALTVFVLLIVGVDFWINSWPLAVVTTPQGIQEGPSAIFASREELPSGVLVLATHKGEWRKILYPSRYQGWIKNTGLEELK
ncbi:hypothetical protein ACJVC5_04850 [Peredibacter sp. HCB2-198]|uniref:hypothetical protein n=1 Tax=Peredibacter sp. HCB2-198 TaxID=3383025 RepID=UPI0038B551B5